MNLLLFNGSPRAKGNTSKLSKAFEELAVERGHRVSVVQDMKSCIHCSKCNDGSPCCLKDSFENQGIDTREIDAIILASPIYFFSLAPKSLAFLSRLYACDLEDKIFGLILVSGSDFEAGGTDLIVNQFNHIDDYCGTTTVSPYHKVTFDKVWDVSDLDREGMTQLLSRIEEEKAGD